MKRYNETTVAPATLASEYRDYERLHGMKWGAVCGLGISHHILNEYQKVSMREHAEALTNLKERTVARVAELKNLLENPSRVKWDSLHIRDQRNYEYWLGFLCALGTVTRIAEFLADEKATRKEGHEVFLAFVDITRDMFDKHCNRNGGANKLADNFKRR